MARGTSRPLIAAALGLLLAAPAAAAPGVEGTWLTEDKNALVTIRPCGGSVCGAISKVLVQKPGVPTTDIKNPNPALRKRPFVGLVFLSGFKRAGTGWEGGRIYDPNTGKTYRSKIAVQPDGRLKVSGCVAFICRSQYWTRAR